MLLNLHCHSHYSDGANSIFELALAYKQLGHIALCITDHNYCHMTVETWEKARSEAALVAKELDFPIVVGLEALIVDSEEVLVFGTSACRSLLETTALNSVKLFKEWYIMQKEAFALILAHPLLHVKDPDFYSLMDGYEIVNSGLAWYPECVERMEVLMPSPRRPYKGQDLHTLEGMHLPCNEVGEDLIIKDETDLIQYLSVVNEWRLP
jgi:hypothetical protein